MNRPIKHQEAWKLAREATSRVPGARMLVMGGIGAALTLASSTALADQGGVAFWLSGQFGSLAAVPASPGWSLVITPYYYNGMANAAKKFQIGGTIAAGLNLNARANRMPLEQACGRESAPQSSVLARSSELFQRSTTMTRTIHATALVCALILTSACTRQAPPPAPAAADPSAQVIIPRLGGIEGESGYPSQESIARLIDETDYQRACQAYIWGLPIVGLTEWQQSRAKVAKVRNGQFELFLSFDEKLGILTPNFDTPYFIAIADLAESGPLVIEMPKGLIAGMVMDAWQRSLTDLGAVGPDKGAGGKYLILGPGQEDPKAKGYYVFRSTTNKLLFGGRLLDPDRERAMRELVPGLRTYPYSERANPPKEQVVPAGNGKWSQTPPTGMAYWETLANALANEPVQERDRFFMAMLKPLGIEKGKPFAPTARQQKILTDAARMGELMAKANTYTKRFEDTYWPGSHWKDVLAVNTTQRTGDIEQLDERASYFYEAVAISEAMRSTTPGFGQRYMGVYQDQDGAWLTGGNNYRLHVPANPPATQFWSVTVYDEKNRQMLINETGRMDVSSRNPAVVKNADGTTDVYIGPTAPQGLENNWVQTTPGEGWFVLFRFYGPTEQLFDKSWVLPDFELVK